MLEEKDFKQKLTAEQYHIMRERGTEAPFSGAYLDSKEKGVYKCAACGNELFSSDTKFDSGSGWPSFDQAIPGSVQMREDNSHGMSRIEANCGRCGSHLGHVFPDGPRDTTGQRFCINSACLLLEKKDGA
jgi:peptide-methionine (R)-S-oxide reductase